MLSIKQVVESFDASQLWQEDLAELLALSKHGSWENVTNWGHYTMLFINADATVFRTICINFCLFCIEINASNFNATDTILFNLLSIKVENKYKNFHKNDLMIVKNWIDGVVFKSTTTNGEYEKWQYDENIDLLILLAED